MLEITRIGQDDEAAQRRWYATMRAAWVDGRPDAVYQPFAALAASYATPPAHARRLWLLALDDGRPVGAAELSWTVEVDLDRVDVELAVLAEHRRRGVGRALAAAAEEVGRELGRTVADGFFFVVGDAPVEESAGWKFATGLGARRVHTELHLVLDLPPDADRLAGLRQLAVEGSVGYTALAWTDRCPDEHVAAYLAMRTQMDADVPAGEEPPTPRPWTVERLRAGEERRRPDWVTLTAAARDDATGGLAGYSELLLPRVETGTVWQEDTLVMPAHRGHRLGLLLKLRTLDLLLAEHPGATAVHTWTAPTNTAMLRTNQRFGYRVAETMVEVHRAE
ncbi:GNAT superfamily N-acetyltransferase [Friedmanniella endophytica]|uniref:GNAT superfamily N-acetyltransferase n=1 Tax=Microlunatus kandeliicorticis TaxID=1759536 RepID=A0A7W3IRP3_9ACTN|nr:GNAT family N-acetyltransferase [Microlunatus kandeliicorticis]MBA8794021.1 GNAT superfamily N-acetyltransferase [Microlunatus kandeliicorticis]